MVGTIHVTNLIAKLRVMPLRFGSTLFGMMPTKGLTKVNPIAPLGNCHFGGLKQIFKDTPVLFDHAS